MGRDFGSEVLFLFVKGFEVLNHKKISLIMKEEVGDQRRICRVGRRSVISTIPSFSY